MDWPERLQLAIQHIEEHLLCRIAIEDVAKIACCSKYHFHRVFYSYFNLTFADYIRKRRLTLAAKEVADSQRSIVDIALAYGYDSPNAFTRAFRNVHGVTPSEARVQLAKLTTYSPPSFPLTNMGIDKVDYKIVEKPSFKIMGKSKDFNFEQFLNEGPAFWKDYVKSSEYKALCKITHGRPGLISEAPLMSAYFPKEQSKHDEFTDVLGIELSVEASEEFEIYTVPAATYVEIDCSYRNALKTNKYIYGEWFSATGYERDNGKPDIASYFVMPYQHYSEMGVRWWVPVVKNK